MLLFVIAYYKNYRTLIAYFIITLGVYNNQAYDENELFKKKIVLFKTWFLSFYASSCYSLKKSQWALPPWKIPESYEQLLLTFTCDYNFNLFLKQLS